MCEKIFALSYLLFTDQTFFLLGFARISNTEFYHMGQEGYINYEDPRFALSYLNTGAVSAIKPSNIRGVSVLG